jgi:putative ABC transport system permease protein
MIRFLFLGLIRDRHRSQFPLIVVALGAMLAVVFHAWLSGVFGDSIEFTARFSTGHVKVMTQAYAENINQLPNDLAILDAGKLMDSLKSEFPDMEWSQRIYFGGLADVPDSKGETRTQGTTAGIGIDLLSGKTDEIDRLNLRKSVKHGRLPQHKGEILISDQFAGKLRVKPSDTISLITTTMYGEYSVYNFVIAGTVGFGTASLDKGTIIADLTDVQQALNMENAAGEILGFFKTGYYNDAAAKADMLRFTGQFSKKGDQFSPLMKSLRDQNNMAVMVDFTSKMFSIMIAIFLSAMALVLWNAGLLGGLRRYGEFGMRLAIGEEAGHVYRTLLLESLLIGVLGSIVGTAAGLLIDLYLQKVGVSLGSVMRNSNIMMPEVFRARISTATWFIGLFPGILATLFGTLLSGIGIYKRSTAQLFKELEA